MSFVVNGLEKSDEYPLDPKIDFVKMFEDTWRETDCSRLEFLTCYVLHFLESDNKEDNEFFAQQVVNVMKAITDGTLAEYAKDRNNRRWTLAVLDQEDLSFKVADDEDYEECKWDIFPEYEKPWSLTSLKWKDKPVFHIRFTKLKDWKKFVKAIIKFAEEDQ